MDRYAYYIDEDLIKIATKEELEADGIDVDYHLSHQHEYVEDKGILVHKVSLYGRREVEIGKKANMITIIQELPPRLYLKEDYTKYQRRVKVKCDCGCTGKVFWSLFNRGDVKSCGCGINRRKGRRKTQNGRFTSNPKKYKELLEALDNQDLDKAHKIATEYFGAGSFAEG